MKDWERPNASSSLDYRATGTFCMFGMGKALLKIFNQTTQYLVTKDTVIAFAQKDAQRSLPLGFVNQHDPAFINQCSSASSAARRKLFKLFLHF